MHHRSGSAGLRRAGTRPLRSLSQGFNTGRAGGRLSARRIQRTTAFGLSVLTGIAGAGLAVAAASWAEPSALSCGTAAPGCASVGFAATAQATLRPASGVTPTAASASGASASEPAGDDNWNLGMAAGTSPSVTALPGGGYEIAFQSSGGQLWTVGSAGWINWGVGLAARTSPSIAALPGGGYEIAFHAAGGQLWTVGAGGWADWNVGLAAGTSPSISGLARGGFEVAFVGADGQLWTVGAGGWSDWHLGVAAGTSPSLASLRGGGFEAAFNSAGGELWSVGAGGGSDWHLGVAAGTSPSLASLRGVGFEVAFHGAGGQLWTAGTADWSNWNVGLAAGATPAIAALPGGGYQTAFESAGGQLWTVGGAGWDNTFATLGESTTPSIAAQSGGGIPVAFQSPDGQLWTADASLVIPPGATGVDISQYECRDIPTARYQIEVVQVTGGAINNPPNSCYPAEAGWAGSQLQAYVFLDGLPATVPPEAETGPAGSCGANTWCLGYNYGWNWTQHWVSYAGGSGPTPKQWWLDVETTGHWADAASNSQVIRGALDALRSHASLVGIYSTPYQWNLITGGLSLPGTPLWVPGAGNLTGAGYTATQFCSDPGQRFAGGVVRYVQYGYGGNFPGSYSGPASSYDRDYAC